MYQRINVTDFGAAGDGKTLCTDAVNNAIRSLGDNGGVLYFPVGVYVCGTIFLESNITFFVDNEAVISGSMCIEDYRVEHAGCIEAPSFYGCLIYAEGKKNITITGGGKIIGNGGAFSGERPMLSRFVKCENIFLENICLQDSASWCNHFVLCKNVTVRKVKVFNKVNGNNDGFDFDDCRDVFITGCIIETGDDSICLKSSSGKMCENIIISDCNLSSRTAAFKSGTASKGGFRNVVMNNCILHDCQMGCIKLICVDGGTLENFIFSNLVMDRVGSPLFIRLGRRNLNFDKPAEMEYYTEGITNEQSPGYIRNIMVDSIIANVTVKDKSRTPIMITGIPSRLVQKVRITNMNVTFPGGGTAEDAEQIVAEDEFRYPEQWFFGVLPAWGIFARHIDGLVLNNVNVETASEDVRKSCIFEDVKCCRIMNSHLSETDMSVEERRNSCWKE